ncbi:hypothetical protein BO71DRAFT_225715 [Aspergillus ellipticus CBS 707.79]|uniref:GPI inositol-deacylase winged helix domain-containing protein n=1 Tax=Aspergillus ellipticus CBS 707.79 TaxID=1448320 RepID=A0A319DB96_9EURO|nr:hypothetical protein BO71DRAFT_225715 [Aspergillus ellipticus CBS 707.79]
MFQWTHLQLEQLTSCRTQNPNNKRLDSLPSGLKKPYDEIYARIKEQDDLAQEFVDRAVGWVMCAAKPLTSNEILSAIRIDIREGEFQVSGEINENDLLFFCQHLLVIDQQGIWRMSHLSVMEYFEQNYWTLQKAHLHVGNTCLQMPIEMFGPNDGLYESDDEIESSELTVDETPPRALGVHVDFQKYVQLHWFVHVRAQNESETSQISSMTALLVKFLGTPHPQKGQRLL